MPGQRGGGGASRRSHSSPSRPVSRPSSFSAKPRSPGATMSRAFKSQPVRVATPSVAREYRAQRRTYSGTGDSQADFSELTSAIGNLVNSVNPFYLEIDIDGDGDFDVWDALILTGISLAIIIVIALIVWYLWSGMNTSSSDTGYTAQYSYENVAVEPMDMGNPSEVVQSEIVEPPGYSYEVSYALGQVIDVEACEDTDYGPDFVWCPVFTSSYYTEGQYEGFAKDDPVTYDGWFYFYLTEESPDVWVPAIIYLDAEYTEFTDEDYDWIDWDSCEPASLEWNDHYWCFDWSSDTWSLLYGYGYDSESNAYDSYFYVELYQ